MKVNSPGKQQRTGGACPFSLTAYENTHRIYYSYRSAGLPSTIMGSKSPPNGHYQLLSQELKIPIPIAASVALIPTSDAAPDGDRPAITLFHRQPAPASPAADIYTTPRSWSLPSPHFRIPLLNHTGYMFNRFAALPPSIIDHLAGIHAAKAATEGERQQLCGSHPLRSPTGALPNCEYTTDW